MLVEILGTRTLEEIRLVEEEFKHRQGKTFLSWLQDETKKLTGGTSHFGTYVEQILAGGRCVSERGSQGKRARAPGGYSCASSAAPAAPARKVPDGPHCHWPQRAH